MLPPSLLEIWHAVKQIFQGILWVTRVISLWKLLKACRKFLPLIQEKVLKLLASIRTRLLTRNRRYSLEKKLEIQTWDTERRRLLERQGYVIERGTLQTLVMRLDFPEGIRIQ